MCLMDERVSLPSNTSERKKHGEQRHQHAHRQYVCNRLFVRLCVVIGNVVLLCKAFVIITLKLPGKNLYPLTEQFMSSQKQYHPPGVCLIFLVG